VSNNIVFYITLLGHMILQISRSMQLFFALYCEVMPNAAICKIIYK